MKRIAIVLGIVALVGGVAFAGHCLANAGAAGCALSQSESSQL